MKKTFGLSAFIIAAACIAAPSISHAENFSNVNVYKKTTTGSLKVGGHSADSLVVIDSALTGYSTNPTDSLRCAGDIFLSYCYQVAGITGTSNASTFTIGHLPIGHRPSHTVKGWSLTTNNGVTKKSSISISSAGVITPTWSDTAGVESTTWTTSGTKSIAAGTIYLIPRF